MINSRFAIWLLFLLPQIVAGQSISRVEPPNWWIGMQNHEVQIMIYGDSIGHLGAKTNYKGLNILKSECPENANYLFITINIDKNIKAGNATIQLLEGKRKVLEFEYPILIRKEDSAKRVGYSSEDVIYLITPDRYANGDENNDNIEGLKEGPDRSNKIGRHGGDIEGIHQHLDYIAKLGFTAIWPNPLLENDMPKYSYHGYAITDFYKVDPRMGSNSTYRDFCAEANKKGLKIIMDMIINHCGSSHWWIKDPPTQDWINYYNQPYINTNHRKTLQLDPYAAQEDIVQLEDGWFVPTMPDLNVHNPWLATYLIQNSIWWIEYAGLQGIRMDTYLYPNEDFMSLWAERVMNEYPSFNITGEVWHDNPAIVSYWQRDKKNANGYQSYLPSLFDFPLQSALYKALTTPDVGDGGWIYLYEMLAQDFQYPDPENLVVFADNHDMVRIFSQLGEDVSKLKMALAYILTVRGIPQVYYGTEILMKSPTTRDDGLVRSDFPGGWKGDTINAFTKTHLTHEQIEVQEYLQQILQWRKKATAIQHGKTIHYVPKDGVYVLFRYNDQQKIMIILNKNEKMTTLKMDRFKRMLGDAVSAYDILQQQTVNVTTEIILNHPGPMILEIKN